MKQEFHDIDYVDQLSDKDKKYLSTFMEENLGANLNHQGRKINKTKEQRKSIFDANNARQRDIYAIMRASGRMVDIDPELVMNEWQERYSDPEADAPELTEKENELLTKREFIHLMKTGAIVPDSLVNFYKKLYKIT